MNRPLALTTAALAAVSAIFAGSGCLKRHEIIQVRPNGGVSMTLEYSGPKEDLEGPDAMPNADSGWTLKRSIEKSGDEEIHVLKASADFAPERPLPATFGDGNDVVLQFPTKVTRESRADGVFYTFRRTYTPRLYARMQYWNDRYINDDIKQLGDKPSESLSQEERTTLIRAFAEVESHQQLEVLRLAVDAALPNTSQAAWLQARKALLTVYEQFDYARLAETVKGMTEDAANEKIVQVGESIPRDAERAFTRALTTATTLTDVQVAAFRKAIERETLRRKVTDSTRSHAFRIELALPGEIVGHNGDSIEDGRIVWEFDGRAFCDRPFALMAVSRVQPQRE